MNITSLLARLAPMPTIRAQDCGKSKPLWKQRVSALYKRLLIIESWQRTLKREHAKTLRLVETGEGRIKTIDDENKQRKKQSQSQTPSA